jgi:bilin biosynthesis protein
MMEEWLLELALTVLTVLVGLLLVIWSGRALWKTWRGRMAEPAVERARALLIRDLAAGRITPETERAARSLSANLQMQLFTRVGRQISGRQRSLITELAGKTGLYRRAELDCGGRRWPRRLRGMDALTLLGGGAPAAAPLLRDRSPYVRAQAAEWAVEHPSPPVLSALLDLLDDPDPTVRFAGSDAVLRMGPAVVGAIAGRLAQHADAHAVHAHAVHAHAEHAHAEHAHAGTARLLQVAAGIRDPVFIQPASLLSRAEDPVVRSGAVALLGLVGGEEAVARAQETLHDVDPRVRTAAARALGNLAYWPAAPDVGKRLRDPSWDVRREAGLALRAMGAPGQLVLRRATDDEDPFAADMARMTLALPGTGEAGP